MIVWIISPNSLIIAPRVSQPCNLNSLANSSTTQTNHFSFVMYPPMLPSSHQWLNPTLYALTTNISSTNLSTIQFKCSMTPSINLRQSLRLKFTQLSVDYPMDVQRTLNIYMENSSNTRDYLYSPPSAPSSIKSSSLKPHSTSPSIANSFASISPTVPPQ